MPKTKFKTKKIEDSTLKGSSSRNTEESNETLEEFYEEKKGVKTFDYPNTRSRTVVISLVVGIVFGFLSGMIGVIFFFSGALSFLNVSPEDLLPTQQLKIERHEQVNVLEDERIGHISEKVIASTVSVFRKKEINTNLLDNIYLPNNSKGSGFILTNDGWIITHAKAINDTALDYVVITNDKQILDIDKIIFDDYSGVVFLKTKADNLSTLPLSNIKDVQVGERLIVVKNLADKKHELKMIRIQKKDGHDNSKQTDLIKKTIQAESFIYFDSEIDDTFLGSPIVNMAGDVVGLAIGQDNIVLGRAIDDFKLAVNQVLDGKDKIERTALGVRFIDLSQVVGTNIKIKKGDEISIVDQGAYITEVLSKTPASEADLEVGDIVIQVGDDFVSSDNSFNRLLQRYITGDSFNLTILRQDVNEEIMVTISY
ncbi:MAG: PDZ domain-containing protein [Patescibacteria group bacterium]